MKEVAFFLFTIVCADLLLYKIKCVKLLAEITCGLMVTAIQIRF